MLYTPSFRKSAYALTTAAALGMGALFPQTANALTVQECKWLAGAAGAYVKAQPKGTFSTQFLDSVKSYLAPDFKTLNCSGKNIVVTSISDLAGWLAIENGARQNGVNVAKEVVIVVAPGSDPKVPALVAQRDRNVGKQASVAP